MLNFAWSFAWTCLKFLMSLLAWPFKAIVLLLLPISHVTKNVVYWTILPLVEATAYIRGATGNLVQFVHNFEVSCSHSTMLCLAGGLTSIARADILCVFFHINLDRHGRRRHVVGNVGQFQPCFRLEPGGGRAGTNADALYRNVPRGSA